MKSRMESKMSSPVVIGVDIGKEVFHLGGFAADGKIAFRRRIRRLGLRDAFEKLPPCIVRRNAHWNTERQTVELGSRPRVPRSGAGAAARVSAAAPGAVHRRGDTSKPTSIATAFRSWRCRSS